MKNDLATAIIAAISGMLLAYFISNMVISKFAKSTYEVKSADSSITAEVPNPDPEVFNYKSLNPTVEVFVGDCTEVNMYGECIQEDSDEIDQSIIENTEGDDQNGTSD